MDERNHEASYEMNAALIHNQIRQLMWSFKSCSTVNSDGTLLSSNDRTSELLTTTRLVAFQIVKKYLNPQPKDLFFMNDPKNGGYSFLKLIFVAAIDANLFLIWDEPNPLIDFKFRRLHFMKKIKKMNLYGRP
ncbi:MAG: hypothetical protein H7328_11520 [Bdellovibrio sp.]|nr:hypothetical protein [Bdellovibrio sp.]